MSEQLNFEVPTMAEMVAKGEVPEILFWVGCAGSYDERAQKTTRDICKILHHVGLKYAVWAQKKAVQATLQNVPEMNSCSRCRR